MRGVPRARLAISFAPSSRKIEAQHPALRGDDGQQFLGRIEVEPDGNAEAVAQGRGEQAGAGGGADQRERRKLDLHRARRRPFADDEIEFEILHRRIKDFFDRRIEAMDLVDEENIARLEIGEDGGKIARLGQHRSGGGAEIDAQFARHDLRQRRLAQAGRTENST